MNVTHICYLKRCMYREITRTELVQSMGKNDLFQEGGRTLHEEFIMAIANVKISVKEPKSKKYL